MIPNNLSPAGSGWGQRKEAKGAEEKQPTKQQPASETSTCSALDHGKKNQKGTESQGDRALDKPLAGTRGLEEGEGTLEISVRQSLHCHPI